MNMPEAIPGIPRALHRGASDLPYVRLLPGVDVQLQQVNLEQGLWVVRTRFDPGTTLPRHLHTGEVFAITFAGSWRYLEYQDVNTAGSYLYEPAGSTHTIHVPATNVGQTDVWFAIRGANLDVDAEGKVISVLDAKAVLDGYLALCEQAGYGRPPVIGI